MLDWIRGKRFDVKTTIIVIVVALVAWAFVIYANLQDFIPGEFRESADTATSTR